MGRRRVPGRFHVSRPLSGSPRDARRLAAFGIALAVGACGAVGTVKGLLLGEAGSGPARHLTGFIGGVAADEPTAALVGREILRRGGDAADAALAVGTALAVTLPSRASLDGGGACVAFKPGEGGAVLASVFLPEGPDRVGPGADRPASVPMLLRGLFALQDRLGVIRFDQLIEPAASLARRGFPVSVLLASDLQAVEAPLLADAPAGAIFSAVDGSPLQANDTLIERDLATTLDTVARTGPTALVRGDLAARFAAAAAAAGAGLDATDLDAGHPSLTAPITVRDGRLTVAFTPLPETGGVAAARAFSHLAAHKGSAAAAAALARDVAAYARATGASAATLLRVAPPSARLPSLPASTSFVVLDRSGEAVGCALTDGNLFGTGRVAAGTGIVLAATSPAHPPPLLPAAIAFDRGEDAFRAVVAASGQDDAAAAVAEALANTLRTGKPIPSDVTAEGRVNVIGCPDLLPGSSQTCGGATDKRGNGLALGNL